MMEFNHGARTKNGFWSRSTKLTGSMLGMGLGGFGLGLMLGMPPVSVAYAQEQAIVQKTYEIPAGPLGQSLNTFASEARITLSFSPDLVSGKMAPALSGDYSTVAGLQTLLLGSGLRVVDEGGAYKITKSEQSAVVLAPINVYGRQKNDSAKDIPQRVQVVDHQAVELTQANQIGEVMRLIPNASRSGSSQDMFADNYRIRGYDAAQSTNGLGFTRTDHPTDLANVERIEVLYGPASVLYSQMEPGGTINVVTKQPLPYFHSEGKVQAGSYDSYRGEFDVTGPVNDRLRVRMNAAYEDKGSALDNWGYSHKFFAPNVTVDLTDDTNLTIEGSYSENGWTAINAGTPFAGAVTDNPNGKYAKSFNVASGDSFTDRDSYNVNTRLTHALTDSLDARFSYSFTRNASDFMEYYSTGLAADNRTVNRRVFIGENTRRDDHEVILDLTGEVETGAFEHKFITGLNYRYSDDDRPTKIFNVGSIDLYNPQYTNATLLAGNQVRDRTTLQEDTVMAAFLQDRVTWNDDWHFLAGVRFINSEQSQTTINNSTSVRTVDQVDQSDLITQFGIIHDLTKNVSVYASRSESFVPQQGTTSGKRPLEAEQGTQYEIGTKFDFGGLQASVTGFVLTKDNIAIEDPADDDFEVAEGQSRSKGIELSLSGNVLPQLYLAANYGFTKTSIRKTDDQSLVGNSFANVPKHTASLQGRYDFSNVPGLSIGSTVAYVGDRYAEDANTTKLPSHVRADLGAFYTIDDNLKMDFLVSNLFDEEIYSPGSISGVVREEGRVFTASLTYTY
ncbi:TonB-dependent siderophore receptor [Thalassospira indica]|uniref:TonB-dependent receptor n=1 Tax=Thalassospira indica TaxID=1891279 RepID=A0ABM6XV17_9PROT|nr:TonB-dependent receptor [Thalassospira indica]AXO13485.1 TonB-dependent receptor [Thalassospira indica]